MIIFNDNLWQIKVLANNFCPRDDIWICFLQKSGWESVYAAFLIILEVFWWNVMFVQNVSVRASPSHFFWMQLLTIKPSKMVRNASKTNFWLKIRGKHIFPNAICFVQCSSIVNFVPVSFFSKLRFKISTFFLHEKIGYY